MKVLKFIIKFLISEFAICELKQIIELSRYLNLSIELITRNAYILEKSNPLDAARRMSRPTQDEEQGIEMSKRHDSTDSGRYNVQKGKEPTY